ncbi:MAG: POT family MFS transporter [Akkermansiaceae bacterium]|nr:POT family MFS transporter [Akkermansiaceae bacterium]MBJ7423688.1 POT family MFS transporter [Akkermansiaceae bacterium]
MSYRSTPQETTVMPPGIPYIIGNEAAERFSFYGMRTILVVFMLQYLHFMDGAGGRALTGNQAVEYYHQFASWVYFTPLLGALVADIFLGKYLTILWLSIVYCLGHAALACMGYYENSPWWLFAGLLLICIGSGGIKPCVSAHVGDQFGGKNQKLLSRVYNWFYFSINFGSFFSTLLTPWLLEKYGPHWAFGVPGVLMAIATLMFWLGRNRFVHVPPSGRRFFKEAFSREGIVALGKLIPLFFFIAVFWSLYDQTGSSWVLQAEQMDLRFLGVTWLESQVQAVNPILVLVFIPLFTFVIYPWCNKIFSLTPLRKIGLGMILMTVSFALVTLIQTWIDAGERPSIGWQVAAFFIITAAEIMVAIVGMEFAYTQAPRTMKSWVMALFWLAVWGGNQFTAQVNHFIAIASPAEMQFEKATLGMPSDWENSPRTISLPGFDGVIGTADDFVARCRQGRMNSLEIPGREIFLDAASRIEAASQQNLPSNKVGNELLGGVKDPWKNPLVYDVIDSSHARISSAGPDRTAKTQWDIGVMIEKTNGSDASADDTWLGRRKIALGIREQPTEAGFSRSEFSGGQSRLEGAAYFRFFTWLVLATTVIFIPFAYFYQPKTYLHD